MVNWPDKRGQGGEEAADEAGFACEACRNVVVFPNLRCTVTVQTVITIAINKDDCLSR